VAPSGERLRRKGRHGVFAGKTVRSIPERFDICRYKRRYINTLSFLFYFSVANSIIKFTVTTIGFTIGGIRLSSAVQTDTKYSFINLALLRLSLLELLVTVNRFGFNM